MNTKVRMLRQAKGWSQGELAHAAGVRVATVSKVESTPERVELETLIKIAAGLEVPLADLFDERTGYSSLRDMIGNFLRLPAEERDSFTRQIEAMADRHGSKAD